MDAVELSDQAKSYEKSVSTPKQAVYANPTTVADATLTPSPWAQLTAHELSEILMAERPIVIAVVLNQVPMQLAASLLQLLPEELAIASLGKLPQVQGTPQDILQEIQEQLEQRMESHRLPLRAAQEGIQRLRSILDIADQRFRSQCMQHICREEPTLARRLGWEAMAPKSKPEIPTDDAPARAMPDPAVSIQGRVPPSDIESTSTEPPVRLKNRQSNLNQRCCHSRNKKAHQPFACRSKKSRFCHPTTWSKSTWRDTGGRTLSVERCF